jgi:hypothetical protein
MSHYAAGPRRSHKVPPPPRNQYGLPILVTGPVAAIGGVYAMTSSLSATAIAATAAVLLSGLAIVRLPLD